MGAVKPAYTGTFPGKPEQISRVREEVRSYLDGCPVTDDVVLIVSELATNAVLHSRSKNGTFEVSVECHDADVYLEVVDAGGPWSTKPADSRPHGLDIVKHLAERWGVLESHGRIVWARVSF